MSASMFFHLFQAFFEDVKCCRAEVQTQARDVIFKLFLVTFFFFFPRPVKHGVNVLNFCVSGQVFPWKQILSILVGLEL